MDRLIESIEINLPVETVFNFLRDIESRMRLCPSYEVLKFEKMTSGRVGEGTRFHIVLKSGERKTEYQSEVVRFVENKMISTRETGGRLGLTLKLKKTPRGTLLTHEEEFEIPQDILKPGEEKPEEEEISFVREVVAGLKELSTMIFGDPEEMRRAAELKAQLGENLRVWLGRIKEALEKQHAKGNNIM